jgi:hypothetical protein
LFTAGRSRSAGKDEEFYVRVGPDNQQFSTGEVLTYVTNRNAKATD